MCIDTNIISIPCAVTEILTKTEFSVMAALICILCRLPKGDRVASSRFLKSTSRRYRNSKKTLYGPYCKVVQKSGVWQPDYNCGADVQSFTQSVMIYRIVMHHQPCHFSTAYSIVYVILSSSVLCL